MIFRNWVLENFPFLEDDFDALTDYELFCKMMEYVKKLVKNDEDFNIRLTNLENTINNLDLQEEVNNKLDEMAESGELEEIIGQYLNLSSIFTFNNINEMISSENLINNSKAIVFGKNNYKDGGFKIFIIKDATDMQVDNINVYTLSNGKYAILVNESVFKNDVNYERFRYEDTNCFIINVSKYDKYYSKNIFKIGIANDYIGDNHKESTMKFAQRKNTTICTNAGVFNLDSPYQIWGACIINGEIVVNNPVPDNEGLYYFTIDDDGHFGYVQQDVTPSTMIANGVKNAILGFFPLIVDGNVFDHGEHYLNGKHPRLVYCENYDGSQFIFACEGRLFDNVGLDFSDIQTYLLNNYPNIKFAMALDGGGSLSVNVYKQKLNKSLDNNYTEDRPVPYFIYLANENATNTEQNDLNKILSVLGNQIYNLQTQINTLNKIYNNTLNLISDENYPNFKIYTNNTFTQPLQQLNFEKGAFSVQTVGLEDEVLETVLIATKKGIYNVDGMLGRFLENALLINNLNSTDLISGIYYTNNDTLNKIYSWQPVIYIKYTDSDILEILLPTSEASGILYRRYDGTNWTLYSELVCTSADRPTTHPTGMMVFDTTLGIPIWYDGTNWVDATGTQV